MASKSDANLIKGAYAAAGGGIKDFGLAGSKAATSISKTLMEPVIKEVQGRSNEFEEYVDWELSRDTSMNEATYKAKSEDKDLCERIVEKINDYCRCLCSCKIVDELD